MQANENILASRRTVIDAARKMPEVDPKSIVLWGDSGGGSLAMELAGETKVARHRAAGERSPTGVNASSITFIVNLDRFTTVAAGVRQDFAESLKNINRSKAPRCQRRG